MAHGSEMQPPWMERTVAATQLARQGTGLGSEVLMAHGSEAMPSQVQRVGHGSKVLMAHGSEVQPLRQQQRAVTTDLPLIRRRMSRGSEDLTMHGFEECLLWKIHVP